LGDEEHGVMTPETFHTAAVAAITRLRPQLHELVDACPEPADLAVVGLIGDVKEDGAFSVAVVLSTRQKIVLSLRAAGWTDPNVAQRPENAWPKFPVLFTTSTAGEQTRVRLEWVMFDVNASARGGAA
jgi:hypothetical protein